MEANLTIRPTTPDDSGALQDVERAAGEMFRTAGYPAVADDEPFPAEVLAGYAAAGRAWLAADDSGRPIGYVIVDLIDGNAHVEQVSVHPEHQGQGVGRALLDQVTAWAAAAGCPSLTLTTFAEVPWNRPLFERLGFRVLGDAEIGPDLRAVRRREAAAGLDPARRVCMSRAVGARFRA